jgi:gluconate 2-dehydrogenase gamma chain
LPISRRQFIKIGAAGAIGFGVASAIEIPILESMVQSNNNRANAAQTQVTSGVNTYLTLNPKERTLVEAIAEAMIPSDSSGPGAKEAGVSYFIDHMLAGGYGQASGKWWYMQGPFITPQPAGTNLTVMGAAYPSTTKTAITYANGTIKPRLQAGTGYQYGFNAREFWRRGLVFLENYCMAAKNAAFEDLSSADKITILQDLFNNSPSNTELQKAFTGPKADEFFNDVHDMVIAGFLTDPIYGGNQNLVGWKHIGFNGSYWGEDKGLGPQKLMIAGSPTRLEPRSLGQLQKEGGMVL